MTAAMINLFFAIFLYIKRKNQFTFSKNAENFMPRGFRR